MFRALARGRRRRAGSLVVSAVQVGLDTDPPRLAFAINRSVGTAVERNRVRRRLRAAARAEHARMRPGWGYLVQALPAARLATYGELSSALMTALRAHDEATGP
jgi:ribonuclease P protein component